jgi:hypothetical protein
MPQNSESSLQLCCENKLQIVYKIVMKAKENIFKTKKIVSQNPPYPKYNKVAHHFIEILFLVPNIYIHIYEYLDISSHYISNTLMHKNP